MGRVAVSPEHKGIAGSDREVPLGIEEGEKLIRFLSEGKRPAAMRKKRNALCYGGAGSEKAKRDHISHHHF